VYYSAEGGTKLAMRAALCERRSTDVDVPPRFCCWTALLSPNATAASSLQGHDWVYSVQTSSTYLLQFQFPVTEEEARVLTKASGAFIWSPIKPNRWARLHGHASAKADAEVLGSPLRDFHPELFLYDYRVYTSEDRRTLLVPLLDEKSDEGRSWFLLEDGLQRCQRLFEAKSGMPPCHPCCSAGPDKRLPHALSRLKEAPSKLRLNSLAHQRGCRAPLMQSGLPFCVDNMAAPRSGDKQAAFSILRMPIFGAGYGVRSRMDQPLGGEEVSAACIGSADNSAMSVLDNETRLARTGNGAKEATALLNKKATVKAALAELRADGRGIYGPAVRDDHCSYPCMGSISSDGKCQKCGKSFRAEELVRKKRLLDDAGSLRFCKKMRLKALPPKHHVAVRGSRRYDIKEASLVLDGDDKDDDGATLTMVPEDCCLSKDRDAALAFPFEVVYFLGNRGFLQASRAPHRSPQRAPGKRRAWFLPPGHYILCEKFRIPRGQEHMNEPVEAASSDGLLRGKKRQRLQITWFDDDAADLEVEEEDPLDDSPFACFFDTTLHLDKAAKELERHLESFQVPEYGVRFDDCSDCQLDFPLVDLDFVVALFQGKAFCAPPQLVRYGAPLRRPCSCGTPSTVSLLKNATETERCILAGRTFQGSLSTLCPQCLEMKKFEARLNLKHSHRCNTLTENSYISHTSFFFDSKQHLQLYVPS